MNELDIFILNFEEVRRRSIKAWTSIPSDKLHWKPDSKALSCAEMITFHYKTEVCICQFI